MAGSPEISVKVIQKPTNDTFTNNNTYSIASAIATGTAYPSDSEFIEVRIINGDGKAKADDIRHLMKPQLTLSFQVMDSTGTSVDANKTAPTGWESWFLCAFNTNSDFTAKFNNASKTVPIKADGQSLDLSNTSDLESACIYGSVEKNGNTLPAENDKYCTMKFRIKPAPSTGAGNYQYILKISGIYT